MNLIFLAAAALCSLQAIRVKRLLHAALWLAGASALTSLLLYGLGAPQAAVIELSVGAGLVFILFVYAINLAPGDAAGDRALVPVPLATALTGLVLLLLGVLAWPRLATQAAAVGAALGTILWEDRLLDALVQIVLIFAGALTVAGLLAPERQPGQAPAIGQPGLTEQAAPPRAGIAQPAPDRQPALPAARGPAQPAGLAPRKEKVA